MIDRMVYLFYCMIFIITEINLVICNRYPYFSYACSIEEADTVTLTGGMEYTSDKIVTRYQQDGSSESLPNLNHGRRWHACGHYTTSDNSIVQS